MMTKRKRRLAALKGWRSRKHRNPSRRSVGKRISKALKKWMGSQKNPHRVKGRRVKGGRAVTLRNMKTITITRHRNGAVSVRGVQLKPNPGRRGKYRWTVERYEDGQWTAIDPSFASKRDALYNAALWKGHGWKVRIRRGEYRL